MSKAIAGQAKTSAPAGATTGRAVSPQAKCDRMGASAGVLAGGPRLSKAKAGQAKTSAPVGPMTGQRGFAERNATEWEQAPGFCRWGPGAAEP